MIRLDSFLIGREGLNTLEICCLVCVTGSGFRFLLLMFCLALVGWCVSKF
jgi:hypothetical protein